MGGPLRKVLVVFREEKWLVVNLAVVGLLLALLALAVVPRTYTTEIVYRVTGTSDVVAATDRYLDLLRGDALPAEASALLAGTPSPATIRAAVSGQAGEDGTVDVRVTTPRAEDGPLLASAVGTAFKRVVDRTESIGRPVNRPASSVEQVGAPSEPTSGPWTRPAVVLPLGILAGAVVGALLAFGRSRRWGTVSDPESLRRHTGLIVLAAVPSTEDPPRHPAEAPADPQDAVPGDAGDDVHEEDLRRRIAAADRLADAVRHVPGTGRTIVFAGAGPVQRTTTVVLDLAATLARDGERVALVDSDVRAGEVAARTGLDTAPGFHDVIRGPNTPTGRAVSRWEEGGVDVLPAGSSDGYAERVLATPRAAGVIRALAADHDRVLVDTAGRSGAAGAADLARHADAAVLVVRRGARLSDVEYALAALRLGRTRLLGAVLTDALDLLAPAVAAERDPV